MNDVNHSFHHVAVRYDWSHDEAAALFDQPLLDLIHRAQSVHRQVFDANAIQISTLLNIKTGACPEDCAYCPQSIRYDTGLDAEALMQVDEVIEAASTAKANGATRFCMGAAWRSPKEKDFKAVLAMVQGVKDLGLQTCMTLGMLSDDQVERLSMAGLDYYNHNLDTSREFYSEIITTRTYQDRLDTLRRVREAGIHVCSGGIVGMGEDRKDRINLLLELATLPEHPQSVPINLLVQVKGTPLEGSSQLDPFEFVRMIAVARLMMPASYVRLSAGRENMNDEMQALCFMAGANSIFYGEKLLTTSNPATGSDQQLFNRLGLRVESAEAAH